MIATSGSFATLANVATVLGAAISAWGVVSRLLRNARVKRGVTWLSRTESQAIAIIIGLFAGTLVLVAVLAITNYHLVNQDIQLAKTYSDSAKVITKAAPDIERGLNACLAKIPPS